MSSAAQAVDWQALVAAAAAVRLRAHAPYSNFQVGAALLAESGAIYVGCNVENASYGATVCAERNAVAALVAGGDRRVVACAIVTAGEVAAGPCGLCRQVLAEFALELPIVLARAEALDVHRMVTLGELLPCAFRGDALAR